MAPDHAPEAVHDVASVDDQVSVDEPPLVTEVGLAVSDTVGAEGGGREPATVTCAEALESPPRPVQVMENVLLAVRTPVDSLPEDAFAPDHAPEALHVVAFVDDHVSIDEPPPLIDAGSAARETVGAPCDSESARASTGLLSLQPDTATSKAVPTRHVH
jgi:hypothetical protein